MDKGYLKKESGFQVACKGLVDWAGFAAHGVVNLHTAAGFVYFIAEQAWGGMWVAAAAGVVVFVHVHSVAVSSFSGDEQQTFGLQTG